MGGKVQGLGGSGRKAGFYSMAMAKVLTVAGGGGDIGSDPGF